MEASLLQNPVWWLALAIFVLACLTALLVLYARTLWQTAADLARDARSASERQERDLRQALALAEQSAQAARASADRVISASAPYLAPVLRLDDASLVTRPPGRFRPEIRYAFRNYGNTPATVISVQDYLVRLAELPGEPVYPPPHADREMVIAAGDEGAEMGCGLVRDTLGWQPREMEAREIRSAAAPFFLVGQVVYDDPFGLRHTKRYCFRFDVITGGLRHRPDGGPAYNLRASAKSPYA